MKKYSAFESFLAEVIDHILVHEVRSLIDVVPVAARNGEIPGGDDAFVESLTGSPPRLHPWSLETSRL